jgi:type VI secretion system secreted protein VgrG
MDSTQENRDAEIFTPLGKDALLLHSMSINEELGRLFSIDVELISKKEDIPFEELLGKNVTLRLNLLNGNPRFFNGHITRFSQTDRRDEFGGVYQATIQPWLWFLTRTSDCKIFQEMTVQEILTKVFSEWGHPIDDRLTRSYHKWEYCVQYRETDFNFVSRLMEQEGIYYFFEHQKGIHTLILADDHSAHNNIFTLEGKVPLYAPGDKVVRDEESCTNWHSSKSILSGTYVLNEYDFERPNANLQVNSKLAKSHTMGNQEIYDYPGEYIQIDDGKQYAQNRIEEIHSQYEVVQSNGNVKDMNAGGLFKLVEHPRTDQNKEYLLTSVHHTYHNDDYGASGHPGGTQYSNSFSAIDSKTTFRSRQITPKPIVQGVQTAIVVGPTDEEIYTDKYSRVKVQFHWDRYGEKNENSSCWMRVSQLWAGKNWGGIHIPRIGQEVIVDFLEGDPDHPIITGRVYNANQMPPYTLPANKTQSGIKSRSSKGGTPANFNEIRMEDKKGKEQLYIHAEKNQDNIVESNETTNVGDNRTETVGSNGDGDETITIYGDRTEIVGKKGDGDETITIYGNRTEKVGVKGDGDEKISIYGDRIEVVGKGKKGGDESITVKGNRERKVKNNETIDIGEVLSITAGESITLHVGDSLFIMKKDGTIELSGKKISITATNEVMIGVGAQTVTCSTSKVATSGAAIDSSAIGTHMITGALVKIN